MVIRFTENYIALLILSTHLIFILREHGLALRFALLLLPTLYHNIVTPYCQSVSKSLGQKQYCIPALTYKPCGAQCLLYSKLQLMFIEWIFNAFGKFNKHFFWNWANFIIFFSEWLKSKDKRCIRNHSYWLPSSVSYLILLFQQIYC